MKGNPKKRDAGQMFPASTWLGSRFTGTKPLNDSTNDSNGTLLWAVDDSNYNLSEVANYPGTMPVLIDALKKKGVRFDELGFGDGEITYLNQNVVILRGAAYEIVHRAFHGNKHSTARQKLRQCCLRFKNRLLAACHRAGQFFHSRREGVDVGNKVHVWARSGQTGV